MASLPKPYLTPEEYLARERAADSKSEYYDGDVFAMASASRIHSQVSANIIIALGMRLRGRPCIVFDSDMRVSVKPAGLYTYPDVSVVCGKARFDDREQDTLLNPVVIVEVLSPSTEAYDRGAKFLFYRRLESLTDYVLIAQGQPLIEHFARKADGGWLLLTYEGLEAVTPLPAIGCELPLAEVYDKVEWPVEEAPPGLTVLKEPPETWEAP